MISTVLELQTTQERIQPFQRQVARLREVEANPENYHASAAGYLAEIDRMTLEVREFLWSHPQERSGTTVPG